jgi:hypothetical protein
MPSGSPARVRPVVCDQLPGASGAVLRAEKNAAHREQGGRRRIGKRCIQPAPLLSRSLSIMDRRRWMVRWRARRAESTVRTELIYDRHERPAPHY